MFDVRKKVTGLLVAKYLVPGVLVGAAGLVAYHFSAISTAEKAADERGYERGYSVSESVWLRKNEAARMVREKRERKNAKIINSYDDDALDAEFKRVFEPKATGASDSERDSGVLSHDCNNAGFKKIQSGEAIVITGSVGEAGVLVDDVVFDGDMETTDLTDAEVKEAMRLLETDSFGDDAVFYDEDYE